MIGPSWSGPSLAADDKPAARKRKAKDEAKAVEAKFEDKKDEAKKDDADKDKEGALPPALSQPFPRSLDDLRAIQESAKRVRDIALKTTVGIIAGGGAGSGVIISEDGYVLTAGHVSGQPGRNVTIVLPDGKRVRGKTLGANRSIDSGLIKITDEGKWPFAEMGKVDEIKPGSWLVATGHPGGWQAGRPAVMRIGRLLGLTPTVLWTDCTLVGGDSGGPLFDMQGHVVGIHSRISAPTTVNFHVPIDTFTATWDRLAQSEAWGGRPFLGIQANDHEKGAVITTVVPASAAARARLKEGDIITKFDGKEVDGFRKIVSLVQDKAPDDEVVIEIIRSDKPMSIRVKLGNAGPE